MRRPAGSAARGRRARNPAAQDLGAVVQERARKPECVQESDLLPGAEAKPMTGDAWLLPCTSPAGGGAHAGLTAQDRQTTVVPTLGAGSVADTRGVDAVGHTTEESAVAIQPIATENELRPLTGASRPQCPRDHGSPGIAADAHGFALMAPMEGL